VSITGFFLNKIPKTQAEKNSRTSKLKVNFSEKLNVFALKLNVPKLLCSKKL